MIKFEQPQGYTADGLGMTQKQLEEEITHLAVRKAVFEEADDEERANPNHSKKDGKFAAKTGGSPAVSSGPIRDYAAITPGKGKTSEGAIAELNKSADGKRLLTVAKKWQGQSGEVEKIQTDFMARAAGKTTRSTQRDAQMDTLMKSIKNSPTNDKELYRGVKMPKDLDVGSLVGKDFVIPPSSFTSDKRISRHFVERGQTVSTTVTYRLAKGKGRAVPIELFGDTKYAYEKESISAGQFKVTKVEKVRGGWIADIEHNAMFSWEG